MKLQYKAQELPPYLEVSKSGWGCTLFHRLLLLLACGLFGISGYAQAVCPGVANVTLPSTAEMDSNLPVGSVIYSMSVYFNDTPTTCYPGEGAIPESVLGGANAPNGPLYPTNIPGVSYKVKIYLGAPLFEGQYLPMSYTGFSSSGAAAVSGGGRLLLEFVKTGPVSAGTFPAGTEIYIVRWYGTWTIFHVLTSNALELHPKIPTCTTSTPVIPVTLNTAVSGLNLSKAGDTAADKQFKIQLTCTEPTNLSLQFSGEFVNASQAVYKNTNATTGSSVGIQILKDGNPVPNGSGNKISLGMVTGDISPEFTARYYALTNSVPAGDVSAVAFADIIYN